jgi:peptidoglycan/LPS O-acetylase OafA/YrhL
MRAKPVRTIQLSPPCPAGVRLEEIDLLKGFALILVLLYHGGGVLGYEDWLHGEVGVDIFLVLSGITLVLNSTELPVGEFIKRRFFRIYPSYWAALAFFLVYNAKFYADYRSPADIVLHILGLHGFSKPQFFTDINDSFWFISIIVLLYVVFLALRRHLHDLALVAGIGGLLTGAVCIFYRYTNSSGGLIHLGVRVPDIFIGLILGQIASGRPLEIRYTPLLAAGLIVGAYLSVFLGINFGDPFAGLAWIALFLCVNRRLRQYQAGRAVATVLSFLGIYSYEIYLIHQPLIRDYDILMLYKWWHIFPPTRSQILITMVVAFALVVFASVALHKATDFIFRSLRRSSLR